MLGTLADNRTFPARIKPVEKYRTILVYGEMRRPRSTGMCFFQNNTYLRGRRADVLYFWRRKSAGEEIYWEMAKQMCNEIYNAAVFCIIFPDNELRDNTGTQGERWVGVWEMLTVTDA